MSTTIDITPGFQDYYETLQLSPHADAETIDRVFRILVKRYHPDNRDTGNSEKFSEVMEAHRALSDSEKRAAYDVRYDENRSHVLKIFDEASETPGISLNILPPIIRKNINSIPAVAEVILEVAVRREIFDEVYNCIPIMFLDINLARYVCYA